MQPILRLLLAAACTLACLPQGVLAAPPAPAGPSALKQFMDANRVHGILDAWLVELRAQWDEQARYMKVPPPKGFWEASLGDFDMAAERRELANAVAAGISEEAMKQDVAWLKASGVGGLNLKLGMLHAAAQPAQEQLAAEARRAAARQGGAPAPASPPPAPKPPSPALAAPDLAKLHGLMDALGYGAPEVLDERLIDAMKSAMPDAPSATWSDAQLLAAARASAKDIEAAFARTWTPAEAGALAGALATPDAKRHDELMNKLTPLVMSRSEPFAKAFQTHLLKAYGKIYSAAWEQHQKQTQRP